MANYIRYAVTRRAVEYNKKSFKKEKETREELEKRASRVVVCRIKIYS